MPKDAPVDDDTGRFVGGDIVVGELAVAVSATTVPLLAPLFETIVACDGEDEVCKLPACWEFTGWPSEDCWGSPTVVVTVVVVADPVLIKLFDALFWNSWKSHPTTSSKE